MADRLAMVSGGAGFIGSHITEGLVAEGYRVRVLDDFSSGNERNLRAVEGDVEVMHGDCADPAAVARAMAGCELVYHEAALPSVARSVEDPVGSNRTNVDGTLTMLCEARRVGVRRFVFAGSSSAYGESEALPKVETMTPDPLSPYAAQKLASESYCRVFARCYGLPTVVLRYFNVYGPRQDPSSPYSGVISLFITRTLRGETSRIYGDGEQTRDFVFVEDVVRANLAAAARDVPPGAVLNIAGGQRISVNELYRSVRDAVGGDAGGLSPIHDEPRAGDVRHSLADTDAAREALGYSPTVPLDVGIHKTVEYYRMETAS